MDLKKVMIFGVPFLHITMDQFVETINEHVEKNEKIQIITANPEIVMKAKEDSYYKDLLIKATYVTPDGIGIVKASEILGDPLPERVAGYDTMIRFLELANKHNYSIYLLGAMEEILKGAIHTIETQYPNVKIVGSHNGYFDWNDPSIPNEIIKRQPDFIFVALGMPRQEKWISYHFHKFDKGIFMGVGGSFDVLSGTIKRAPLVWQKLNLEWLYRLMKQPSRAKRMVALPKFAYEVIREKVTRKNE
ncbi:WecB/TagA/CpsF family glycosyltransferase [Bacillus suaedaesalsae]|uniref:N-acetylglucosaminyldiphosphoundecaprenol N-acetyl-beta-D-mannosaminyltransferase n=1 Tax=Bacillus suaedaesalsae TaxID=2810349 RepID=A0ABS2DKP2_9BACI|nr:WecB/TagA/CpsF family glycosyltransferase [Bacillus suaedaesalsae]MBM6619071.1 WecB/TagA/CpsF family glycosyltransferase [Bacillus suaedaesalsae]